MQIHATVTVDSDDDWTLSVTEAADAILKALGGDENKDHCVVYVNTTGSVGTPPPPAAPTG
jgi:hypothetical protein